MASTNFVVKNGLTVASGTVVAGGSSGTNGQVLASTGTGVQWVNAATGTGDVVGPASATDNAVVRFDGTTGKLIQNSTVTLSDTGVLTVPEVSTASITSTGNNPIVIAPDGTGDVHLNADSVRIGDNNTDATLTTHGTGDLILTTHEGSATQGIIRLYDGANGNITLTPNGTGQVQVGSDQVVTLIASQTLTNKTLSTSSTWNGNTIGVAYGGTGLTTLTAGYIPYGNGTSAFGSSANLFWDSTNSRLGVGTTSPSEKINVSGGNILVSNSGSCATKYGNGSLTHEFGILSSSYGGYGVFTANSAYVYANSSNVQLGADGGYIAFGTGSGSLERMRIDSSGNVGIGTSSPSAKLDVNGQVRAAYASGFQVDNAGTMLGKLYYSGGLILDRAASTSFFIAQNGSNQVTLDSSGNLGIGTSSPALPLHIYNSGAALAYFETTNANGAYVIWRNSGTSIGDVGSGKGISGSGNATDFMIASRSTYPLLLGTGSAERMRITSGGDVLVNATATADSSKLYVAGNLGTNGSQFNFRPGSGTQYELVNRVGAGFDFYVNNAGTLAARIDSSGNLGIGTASPGYKLTVAGTSGSAVVSLLETGVRSWGVRAGGLATNTFDIADFTAGASRFSIDSSGNVGIGTSSPSAKLQVVGTTKIGEGVASNSSKLMVNTVSGVAAGIQLFQDTVESWIIQNPASITALTFSNSGTERMRIDGSGNVGIGTASPSTKLHVIGDIRASGVFVGNGSTGSYTKGFGGILTTTSTSTPTGGSSGDFTLIY